MDTILILNCYSRNALAVIHALKDTYKLVGADIIKGSVKLSLLNCFFRSRNLTEVFSYRDPDVDAEAFIKDITSICKRFNVAGIIPTGTKMTNALSYYKEELEQKTTAKMAIENYNKLINLADKWKAFLLCQEIGVPVPKTILLEKNEEVLKEIKTFNYPVILKPRTSYAARGVIFIESFEKISELWDDKKYESIFVENAANYLAQEVITGTLHDCAACVQNGKAIGILTQQRMVSLYDFGGGGIVNLTTDETIIKEYSQRIFEKLQWNGPILFDYIRTKEGLYYLLEANPKFWGTTELTIEAGLNFPEMVVDIFIYEKIIQKKSHYETKLLYRWIMPEIFFHWFHRPFSFKKFFERVKNTFKSYGAKRKLHNIQIKHIPHLIGIILNRC